MEKIPYKRNFWLNGYGKGFMLPATVQQAQNSLPVDSGEHT